MIIKTQSSASQIHTRRTPHQQTILITKDTFMTPLGLNFLSFSRDFLNGGGYQIGRIFYFCLTKNSVNYVTDLKILEKIYFPCGTITILYSSKDTDGSQFL